VVVVGETLTDPAVPTEMPLINDELLIRQLFTLALDHESVAVPSTVMMEGETLMLALGVGGVTVVPTIVTVALSESFWPFVCSTLALTVTVFGLGTTAGAV